MGTTAAIFDLDRTLIPRSSAPVFQRHLSAHGLASTDLGLVGDLAYRVFDLFGESAVLMQAARLAPRAASGWSVKKLRKAARAAAAELADQVQPFVPRLLDDHRAEGRRLVMATTTPHDWVAPLAEALGFDDVVATRWAVDGKHYTGRLDGPFVWGRGKLVAVRRWADDEGIDLTASHAYSDSFFDAPLLGAVGHPHAVNPDPRLAALAVVRRWPIEHFDVSPGVVKVGPWELQQLLRPFARPELVPAVRFEFTDLDHIPRQGPAIVCANHRSYFDPVVLSLLMARAGRTARFLGKKEVFDAPLVGQIAHAAGGIRVERASGSDEPLRQAQRALEGGEVIVMMPQGTIPRGPAFFDPELKGRWGAARLAADSGVPVVPVGLWGTDVVWPRSSRLPRLALTGPPLVTARVGPPIRLDGDDPDHDTRRIMAAIVEQLPPEAHDPVDPTPEQLARTYPPGYEGDPTAETDRRPGTDT